MVEVQVNIDDQTQSNRFLRCLWAEFRRACGKCAWQYAPWRDGSRRRITFGWADIGRPEGTVMVGVTYVRKGTVRAVTFEHNPDRPVDPQSELGKLLLQVVGLAKEGTDTPSQFRSTVKIGSLHRSPRYYSGETFEIEPVSRRRFELTLSVDAYDTTDAQTESMPRVGQVLDVLSVETNSAFWPTPGERDDPDEPLAKPVERVQAFADNPGWIDGCPIRDEMLLLSAEGVGLIELVVANAASADVMTLLRACSHFHTARKYAAQVANILEGDDPVPTPEGGYSISLRVRDRRLEVAGRMGAAHAEITGALYMSALEVASKIGAPATSNCTSCGQAQYKISQRVADLLTQG